MLCAIHLLTREHLSSVIPAEILSSLERKLAPLHDIESDDVRCRRPRPATRDRSWNADTRDELDVSGLPDEVSQAVVISATRAMSGHDPMIGMLWRRGKERSPGARPRPGSMTTFLRREVQSASRNSPDRQFRPTDCLREPLPDPLPISEAGYSGGSTAGLERERRPATPVEPEKAKRETDSGPAMVRGGPAPAKR